MKRHTIKLYDKDLHHLELLVFQASKLVLEMFQLHSFALNEFDPDILKKIHKIDKQVNNIDKEISECTIVVLATHQPVAIDLRYVISTLRMSVFI